MNEVVEPEGEEEEGYEINQDINSLCPKACLV